MRKKFPLQPYCLKFSQGEGDVKCGNVKGRERASGRVTERDIVKQKREEKQEKKR